MRYDVLGFALAVLVGIGCSEEAPPAATAPAPPAAATPPAMETPPPPAPAPPAAPEPDPCIQAAACCYAMMASRPPSRGMRATMERSCAHMRDWIGSAAMADRCREHLEENRTVLRITHNTVEACN